MCLLGRRVCRTARAGGFFRACQVVASAVQEACSLGLRSFHIQVLLPEKHAAVAEQLLPGATAGRVRARSQGREGQRAEMPMETVEEAPEVTS